MGAANVVVTPAAEKFMRRLLRLSEHPAGGFRLTVTPGGCSGLSSSFSLDAAPQDGDAVLDVNGLRVFLPAASAALLDGVTVDFADTPTSSGLRFHDPRQAACGCSSAGAAPPAQASVSLDSLRRISRV
ncbi:HesB/IscA family protein [Rubrivivax benzoatilyticus]|uniref:Iron-sulfur cluster assembly accessory protein n=1 Tax=Rubrivivax benzoatilyticus TaxID=316997 RepID=A0ABX0HVJ0_9BURK|nr:iron-sulfur cluster assembly accessory protein [Rubrivivax benzoatilyticus]EGJ10957.1 iron-sulfur cluster assembly accessory protein [Rubrivivax benzoatilyticus JA2 = ATCC BAA-35]NHK97804.1 iron-sulfur cluster assembly accessory protein [Rubrivivax benzoatilyticus]NHL23306.1 iron-sulfur cluster assembly accessory protein [Rubrivivax benzoatilyticus]